MILEDTITIECFLVLWALTTMVFQWFLGRPTIGFNVLRWSRTIGQTMEWFQWIEQVYHRVLAHFEVAAVLADLGEEGNPASSNK